MATGGAFRPSAGRGILSYKIFLDISSNNAGRFDVDGGWTRYRKLVVELGLVRVDRDKRPVDNVLLTCLFMVELASTKGGELAVIILVVDNFGIGIGY